MKICVLCSGFPSKRSASCVFVVKLCEEMARQGHKVTIIAPQNLMRVWSGKDDKSPTSFVHKTATGEQIDVKRPYIFSFGKVPVLSKFNNFFRGLAVKRAVAKAGEQDAYYGHFWDNGYLLYNAVKRQKKPLFVATGESKIWFHSQGDSFPQYVSGVICVSSKNKEESIAVGLTTEEKCIVIPNATDTAVFRKMDKLQCRQKLGIGEDLFVVIYVGQFIQRKGYNRVAAAIDRLNDKGIGVIFLGAAKEGLKPQCRGIIKCGLVAQNEIPQYLNAADVYVLPTRAEGCCNAIVEAMACGLPIVSSDQPFNYDILDSTNALLVDPDSIDEIANAIQTIKADSVLQDSMSNSSLMKAQELNLSTRAEKIINFIKEKSKK
ncbi:MAG: glycosyltransferase family 4 protein [Bacteroidales bacterium]|nr:glycosyltransferase family 4 protein [Bacteroidales bacterium]MBR6930554.1 glycosyltransferase family 4 protein [Bacteroidales bacterium]